MKILAKSIYQNSISYFKRVKFDIMGKFDWMFGLNTMAR